MIFVAPFLLLSSLIAQPLDLELTEHIAKSGDSVSVDVIVQNNFTDIASVQFSMLFDPTVIQFLDKELVDLDFVAIGSVEAANGELRLSWFPTDGVEVSVPNGQVMVRLHFLVIGNVGDYTDVSFSDVPIAIEVFRKIDGINIPIQLGQDHGSVLVGNTINVFAQVTNAPCVGSNEAAIDLTINDPGEFEFAWTGPNGFISSDQNVSSLESGDYFLIITNDQGEIVMDTAFIVLQPLSSVEISNLEIENTTCSGNDGAIQVLADGGVGPYTYDIGEESGMVNSFTNLPAGTYTLIVTDANGCEDEMEFEIDGQEIPIADLGADLDLCEEEALQLSVGEYPSVVWSTGATGSSISVADSGEYSVTITSNDGCENVDTINVQFLASVVATTAVEVFAICPGDSIQLNIDGNGDTYEWLDPNGTLSATNIPNPISYTTENEVYDVVVSNECGSEMIEVPVEISEITAFASADTCIAPGTPAVLFASGGVSYSWSGPNISSHDLSLLTVNPSEESNYFVMIVDANGCTTIEEVKVEIANNPSEQIKAVNMITPNGDGKNDVLEFNGLLKFGSNTFTVFNRWGDTVYSRFNYQTDEERFDGTYREKPLPAGTYYYVLQFKDDVIKQAFTIARN